MERTADPTCFIEERGPEYVIYQNVEGERWIIRGVCAACGECEVGRVDPEALVWTGLPIGTPGAALDPNFGKPGRLDNPVRPELTTRMEHCTLRGEYIGD